ncbi:helix-turn-helix transcriptional regulator [Algihabitans sp.]|uniref:helix-turn-helix transcriptional regulator n=1 Tax=Algihabitans sp. TaxID=2821514 RepID=UPI003BAD8F6A
MSRSTRLFEVIQLLRCADQPLTGRKIAEMLEVSLRTVYRDIAALQAMRVPIDGQAGIGYLLRPGYDLPPLNLSPDEAEAVFVGLALLGRTGDTALKRAAVSAGAKISAAVSSEKPLQKSLLAFYASGWNALPDTAVELSVLRTAIREARKLSLCYRDQAGDLSRRVVRPLALLFYIESVVLVAWCDLRSDFRHFRADRISTCSLLDDSFAQQASVLRARWRASKGLS